MAKQKYDWGDIKSRIQNGEDISSMTGKGYPSQQAIRQKFGGAKGVNKLRSDFVAHTKIANTINNGVAKDVSNGTYLNKSFGIGSAPYANNAAGWSAQTQRLSGMQNDREEMGHRIRSNAAREKKKPTSTRYNKSPTPSILNDQQIGLFHQPFKPFTPDKDAYAGFVHGKKGPERFMYKQSTKFMDDFRGQAQKIGQNSQPEPLGKWGQRWENAKNSAAASKNYMFGTGKNSSYSDTGGLGRGEQLFTQHTAGIDHDNLLQPQKDAIHANRADELTATFHGMGNEDIGGLHRIGQPSRRQQAKMAKMNPDQLEKYMAKLNRPGRIASMFGIKSDMEYMKDLRINEMGKGVRIGDEIKTVNPESGAHGYGTHTKQVESVNYNPDGSPAMGPGKPVTVFNDKTSAKFNALQAANDRINKDNADFEKMGSDIRRTIPQAELDRINAMEEGEKYIKKGGVHEGTGGFGLGYRHAINATQGEHAGRILGLANPLGGSSREILANTFGFMSRRQRLEAEAAKGFFRKVGATMPILGGIGVLGFGIASHEDASDIMIDQMTFGALQGGWRVGTAVGGALSAEGSAVGRTIGMAVGGGIFAATGFLAATAVLGGARDMMGNDSGIRKFAKKIGTKEVFARSADTRQSLTARQSALNKLSRSGLNDRNQLLGNEANVLRGLL